MSNTCSQAALVVGAILGAVGCSSSHGSGGGGGGGGATSASTASVASTGVGGAGTGGASTASSAGGSGGGSSATGGSSSASSAGGGSSAASGSSSSGTGGGGIVCPGASISCSGITVDPCNDAANCGSCAHGCAGTLCVAGACQSATLATAQPGVFGVAVDGTNVYWTKDIPNGSPTFMSDCAVMKMPVAGGAAVMLGKVPDGRGYDVAVDGTSVYVSFQWNDFSQEGEVHKVPLAGGAETALTSSQTLPRGLILGVGYLYWGQELQEQLKGVSLTGGPTPSFYDPAFMYTVNHGIAADATSVYGALDFPSAMGGGGFIWKYPAAGGAHVAVATGQEGPNYLAQDATNLYWTNIGRVGGVKLDHQGTVVKMAKAGGAVTILASGLGGAKRIVVDASHVYWNDDVDGVIMKAPIAGGASTILASGQMGANGLAMDGTYVYWTDSIALTVNKVAK